MRYFLLRYVLPFMVALSLHGIFRKREKIFKNISYKFFVITSFALLQLGYSNFLHSFQIILFLTDFNQILLNRYEKVTPFMEFFVKGKKIV